MIHGPTGDREASHRDWEPGPATQVTLGDGRAFDNRILEDSVAAQRTVVSPAWTEVPGRAMSPSSLEPPAPAYGGTHDHR
jgi:hypothetical protein